jgi:hypothetical protein
MEYIYLSHSLIIAFLISPLDTVQHMCGELRVAIGGNAWTKRSARS